MSEQRWNGIPRNEVPWYPRIDPEKCRNCGVCVEFCSHGAYERDPVSGKPVVKNPFNCVVGCSGCKPQCPVGAIEFPPLTILGELLEQKQSKRSN